MGRYVPAQLIVTNRHDVSGPLATLAVALQVCTSSGLVQAPAVLPSFHCLASTRLPLKISKDPKQRHFEKMMRWKQNKTDGRAGSKSSHQQRILHRTSGFTTGSSMYVSLISIQILHSIVALIY